MYEVLNQVLVEQRLRELRAEAEHARLVRIARSGRRHRRLLATIAAQRPSHDHQAAMVELG